METIEIRQNKKILIPILVLLTAVQLGMTYYIYFSGKFDINYPAKIVYAFLTTLLLYAIYIPTKKFFKNEPVLTLSKSEIEINEKGKSISLLWLQIIDWKIGKEEENDGYYLIIETADVKRKINISWLDKSPTEIEDLFQTYKAT